MTPTQDLAPRATIDRLIDRYGFWRVLGTVVATLLRRRTRAKQLGVEHLPDHLRRDIGLPPSEHSPRYWDVRL